jgi:hypothetical protein
MNFIMPQDMTADERREMARELGLPENWFEADQHTADAFAAGSRRAPTRKARPEVAAVNRYQATLESAFSDWADDAAAQLAEAGDDDRDEVLAALLLALLLLLRRQGSQALPEAVTLALERAGGTGTAAIWQALAAAVARNDEYLTTSLLPAIGERLRELLASGEWAALQLEGPAALTDWVMGWLTTFAARVASYAGAWWSLHQQAFGLATDGKPIVAYLDKQARHCSECPRYHSEAGEEYSSYENYLGATGNRTPGQFECQGNCRCWLDLGGGDVAAADDLPA